MKDLTLMLKNGHTYFINHVLLCCEHQATLKHVWSFSIIMYKRINRITSSIKPILMNTHVVAEILITNGETECYVKHRSDENIGASVLARKILNSKKCYK